MAALKKIIHCGDGYIERIKRGAELLQEHGFPIEVDIQGLRYWEVRVPEMSLYNRETFSAVKASRQQLEEITRYVREEIIPQAKFTIYVSDEALTESFRQGEDDVPYFKGGSCSILQNRMFVLPDGKATLCEQLYWHPDFIIGDLTQQTFEEVWNSEKAKRIFSGEYFTQKGEKQCGQCKIHDFCKQSHRKCVVKVMKAYGMDNWDFPDPPLPICPRLRHGLEILTLHYI